MTYLIECLPTVCVPVSGHIVKNIKCMLSCNIFAPKGGLLLLLLAVGGDRFLSHHVSE